MFIGRGMYVGIYLVFLFFFVFDSVSVQVMPRVLSYSTCAVLRVIGLVVACGDCRFIASRLLSIDFLSYIVWVSEDVGISIYDVV